MVAMASALHEVRGPRLLCSEFSLRSRSSLRGVAFGRQQRCARIVTCQAAAAAGNERRGVAEADTFTRYSGYIARAALEEADQLDEYNADKIAAVFRRRPVLLARRLSQIAATLGWWAAVRYGDARFGRKDANFKKRASQLRGALVQLGPTFVKIAQAISSRPDVISPEYLEELALLQDRIAPFSTELALQIIEEDLGVSMEQLFTEISPQPVAAASLGQVYQARLRPNGKLVAVKVQRPGVRAAMALDLFIIRKLAGYAKSFLKLNTDLPSVVDEWASSLFKEMDYQAEARNGIRFRKLFGSLPDVVVPEMYSELTSRRVLIMEWIEGQRLSDVNDLRLVEVGVYCSLTQLLDSGFYHADPHPGNLLRTPDGKLAYLGIHQCIFKHIWFVRGSDFGMMGEMKEDLRDGLVEASVHLVNREFDALAGDFVTLGLLPPNAEKGKVSEALTGVFQEAVSKGVRNISFGDLSGKLGVTMYNFKLRIPSYFSLVIRSLTVLEGIALSSDPNYKVLSSSYPWIARKVLTDKSPKIRSTLQELVYKNGAFRIDRLESLLTESMRQPLEDPAVLANRPIEKEEGKAIRDTRSLAKRLLTFGLTEQGDFVRELILEELAKGIDALNRVAFDAAVHLIGTQSPISLPRIAPATQDEDLKNIENLRQIMTVLNRSGTGTTSGSPIDSSTNFRTSTQVSASNPNEIVETTKVEKVGSSQNGAAASSNNITTSSVNGRVAKTEVLTSSNSNDLVEKTTFAKPGRETVAETELLPSSSSNDLVEKTTFVKPGRETNRGVFRGAKEDEVQVESAPLSLDEINALVQSLSGLSQYLPLLSVFTELPFQAQQQAVLLPADLAGRVASRVVARTIRGSIPTNNGSSSSDRFSTSKNKDLY